MALVILLGALAATPFVTGPAGAQQRRVVVVGDSVILGAESTMVGAFSNLGWLVTFDAAVNRSTASGGDAIATHTAELTDTLVVNLGANDAGNTAAYRSRVERVLASTAGVPRVFWLTIREVRDYYPAANQAVRDVAAAYPNVTVLDWNAATIGRTDLTSSDGLHLNGAGARAMTDLVTAAAVTGAAPVAAAPPPVTPAPVETPPPETAPPVTEVPPAEPAPVEAPPPTPAPTTVTTTAVTPTTASGARARAEEADRRELAATVDRAAADGSSDLGSVVSWTIGGGFALVVVLLGLGGAGVGAWALIGTRSRPSQVPGPTRPPGPPRPPAGP